MNRNESRVAKRKTVNFPIYDANGRPATGLTFLTASGEVLVSLDGATPGGAAANIEEVGRGMYYYPPSQAETNVDVNFMVWAMKRATLDLATLTTNCNTKIRALEFGAAGNDYSVAWVQDGAVSPTTGTLVLSGFVYTFTFKDGVTTVANWEALVAGSAHLRVATAGSAATLHTIDSFAAAGLTGGVETSCTQEIDQYEPGLDSKLEEILTLLGASSGGARATCPFGLDMSIGDMVLEARLGGVAGNDITITVVDGSVFSITESGTAVTLTLPEATKFSSDIEALINSDSVLIHVKTSDSNPSSGWSDAIGGPFPFSGGAPSSGAIDANVVEWKGIVPLDLDVAMRVQASLDWDLVDVATVVWNAVAEGSDTYGDFMRLFNAVLAGKADGFDTGTITFKRRDGVTVALTVITTASGRATVTRGTLTP